METSAPLDPNALTGITAFIMVLDEAGHWLARSDLANISSMNLSRLSTNYDYLAACEIVSSDVKAGIVASAVIQGQVQLSHQIAQQAEMSRIAQEIQANRNH